MFGGTIGGGELLLIGLAILLLFGATKVPELARSLGKSIGEFKKAQHEAEFELNKLTKLENESKIQKMAEDLGIETKNKTEEELLDEIQKKIKEKK